MKSLIILAAFVCTCAALSREEIYLRLAYGYSLADENIPALANSLGETELVKFVKLAGLADTLSGKGPFTVFGPTNDAFNALPPGIVDYLMKNKTLLQDYLLFHVLPDKVFSSQLRNELLVKTAMKRELRINIYKKGDTTVYTAQGSPIIKVDQNATNGVIHELSRVMTPPFGTVTTLVSNLDDFTTLKKAVVAANLQGTLASAGPFTVFAPTNEAFNKLPPGTLDALLKDVKKLTRVLLNHVVKRTFYSAGLSDGMKLTTVNNLGLTISVRQGEVFVTPDNSEESRVSAADVSVSNGAVHVVNRVLVPADMF